MPSVSGVFGWISRRPEFAQQYAKAREAGADALADEIIAIADAVPIGAPSEEVRRAQLRIDTRKWSASKLKPKSYGDRVAAEVTGKDGGPVQVEAPETRDLAKAILSVLHRDS